MPHKHKMHHEQQDISRQRCICRCDIPETRDENIIQECKSDSEMQNLIKKCKSDFGIHFFLKE